jgi:hypothetical protein
MIRSFLLENVRPPGGLESGQRWGSMLWREPALSRILERHAVNMESVLLGSNGVGI